MTATWVALIVYSLAVIALGWRWREAAGEGDSFWTAGRSLGAGSVGMSISAGFMSVSWSCVYATQLSYQYGLGALWLITVPWLGALAGIYLLARRYHRLDAFSQPEMVGQRFGRTSRRVLALPLAFVFLVWGGAEIYVAAKLLAPGLRITTAATIVLLSLVVAIYSMLGGLRAVVATDKLQYALVALYVLTVAGLCARAMHGGGRSWPDLGLPAAATGRSWWDAAGPGLATIAITFLAYLPGWLFETDLWVRVQAARDVPAARRGMLIASLNALLFVGLLPLYIGVAALELFPAVDGVPPAILGNGGDAIFAAVVGTLAPPWLAAVVAIGLVSAAMSTIDTCANVMALAVGYDLLELQRAPAASWRGRWGSQLVTAAVMAASCTFALNTESLWDVFYLSSGVLSTAVAFPVAAVLWPRASRRGVLASSLAGFGATVVFFFLVKAGALAGAQPQWLTDSGLAYIVWGGLAAAVGYGLGAASEPATPHS